MSRPNTASAPRPYALDVVRDEHRAIAAVLDAMGHVVRGIDAGRMKADPVLLASMIDYFAEMPDKLHHPKENRIFAALRARTHEFDQYLDVLEDEHRRAVPATSAMDRALVHFLATGPAGFAGVRDTMLAYITYEFKHLGVEERYVFPAARKYLTSEDWQDINADFGENADPWTGLDDQFVKLFRQIATLTPAPIGLGDAQ